MTTIEMTHPHALPKADPSFVSIESIAHAEIKPGPRGSGDIHGMRAEYENAEFSTTIERDRACVELVHDYVRIVPARLNDPAFVGAFWEVARKPAGSKFELQPGERRIVADVPGCYILRVTLCGGWRRDVVIAAVGPDAWDAIGYLPQQRLEKFRRLAEIVRSELATPESIAAGLENGPADLATVAGFVGKKRGAFSPSKFR